MTPRGTRSRGAHGFRPVSCYPAHASTRPPRRERNAGLSPAPDAAYAVILRGPTLALTAVVAGFLIGVVQSSFFEWAFHRYWLHRPWLPKDCFTTHTLIHHQLCKYEDTFHVTEEEQHEA